MLEVLLHLRPCILALLLLLLTCPALAAPGSWTQRADMPAQASATAGCVVDGIFYVIGGNYPFPQPLRTVWAYDPRTNSWTRKADMPTARNFLAAAAVNGTIYAIGGYPGSVASRTVEAYDPRTDTWVAKANMPTARATLAACAVNGIIYAIGGTDGWPHAVSTVEAYDPTTNQWSTKSSLPKGLVFLTASVVNGLIYVFMGTETFAYDPQTDHWTTKTNHFSPYSWGLMSAQVDGIIYVFGGFTPDWKDGNDFMLAYDSAQDQFTARRRMLRKRGVAACGVIGGMVYLAGGVSKEPAVNPDAIYYTALDVFDPQGGVTPQILSLTCESTNQVRLVWQGEAGISYRVESATNVATGAWARATFTSGTNSVLATNALVEARCLVSPADTRFFRVLETN